MINRILVLLNVVLLGCSAEIPVRSSFRSVVDMDLSLYKLYSEPDGSVNFIGFSDVQNDFILQFDRHLKLRQTINLHEKFGTEGFLEEVQLKNGNWAIAKHEFGYNEPGEFQIYITDRNFNVIRTKQLWSAPARKDTLLQSFTSQILEMDNGELVVLVDTSIIAKVNDEPSWVSKGTIVYKLDSDLDPIYTYRSEGSDLYPKALAYDHNSLLLFFSSFGQLYASVLDAEGNLVDQYIVINNLQGWSGIFFSWINEKILISIQTGVSLNKVQYCVLDPKTKKSDLLEFPEYAIRSFNLLPPELLPGHGHVLYVKSRAELSLVTVDEELNLREYFTIPLPQNIDDRSTVRTESCYTEDGSLVVATGYSKGGRSFVTLSKLDASGNLISEVD